MSRTSTRILTVLTNASLLTAVTSAAPHELDCSAPPAAANAAKFVLGTARNPAGVEIAANGVSILENDRAITPVMGEFHYTRYPRAEWRDELLKMKAGGIDIVASYVFWIHHEEVEGTFDFTGDRDLHAFVQLCGELGLRCIIRCGPWDHGEVRNGGFPEWLLDKHLKLRTDDPQYLAEAGKLYAAIAGQLKGLLWKDGGPVIGIQIENEYHGRPEHLLELKQIAVDAGLDVPLYTRTGWPELSGPMPFGQLLPLFGGYAEGFWDRQLTTMPGRYWKEFAFKLVRTDTAIASEHFGARDAKDDSDIARYPYLTCELGAGMMCSYHRRINVFPMDCLSIPIVKLGSGSNSPGYYMYHGGTNPTGREPWLQEHQASRFTNYNDLPVKTYDFQTALGEYGQVREQYHLLRVLHLFLNDFGTRLAPMAALLPAGEVKHPDTAAFRWAVRTDGRSGFAFVNNYERLLPQPARADTQLKLKLKGGELTFPSEPTTVAADHAFFWPFNFDLGDGVTLAYATAQPMCQVRDGQAVYTLFASTGNPAEFAFVGDAKVTADGAASVDGRTVVRRVPTGTTPAITVSGANGVTHKLILLDEATARTCYKGAIAGQDRVVLSSAGVTFDGGDLRLTSDVPGDVSLALLPAPASLALDGKALTPSADGAFARYAVPVPKRAPLVATVEQVRDAGPLRKIELGIAKVAMQPSDADFDQAAVWRIKLPADTDPSRRLLLRIHYRGDVARAYLGDRLLTDNFYNGTAFDVGVNRYGPAMLGEGVTLKVLPLQKDAPIYMLDNVRPDVAGKPAVASVDAVDVIESETLRLTAK